MASLASINQNIDSIEIAEPRIEWVTLTSANTSKVGAGAVNLFTAGTYGSLIETISIIPSGANAGTVFRVFITDGVTKNLIAEMTLPAVDAASETQAQLPSVMKLRLRIPTGHSIECAIGTAGTAGWQVSAIGGDY